MNTHEYKVFEQKIYAAAPLFFRLKTDGYLDASDFQSDDEEDLAIIRQLGLAPFVPERKYPPIHYWGLETPSGWLPIVLDASIKSEALLAAMLAAGVAVDDLPGCTQIKEKFGELRIYWRAFVKVPFSTAMHDVLTQASEQAKRTCSVCGVPGKSRTGLGLSPFCDECAAQRLLNQDSSD